MEHAGLSLTGWEFDSCTTSWRKSQAHISAWLPNSLAVAGLCSVADRPRVEVTVTSIVIYYQESSLNKKQVKGRIDQVMGQVKQVIGKAVGNKELEQKGKNQEAGGKVQSGHGDRKEDIEDSR